MQLSFARGLRIAVWALLAALLLSVFAFWLMDAESDLIALLEQMRADPRLLWTAAGVYALCLALPYVPGLELGLMMMMVFGRPGVLAAYLATFTGLNLAFAVGVWIRRRFRGTTRLTPWRARAAKWKSLGPQDPLPGAERLARAFPNGGALREYVAVGLLFNVPGNWLIGGGGGIALVSGLCGRFHWRGYAATVAIATALVPLLATFGVLDLRLWLEKLG